MPDAPITPTDDARTDTTAEGTTPSGARRRGRWHVASYGEQRICSRPGCGTKLSRYNEKSYCASHDPSEF